GRTPYDEAVGREWMSQLDRALDDLPPPLKTVFVLAEIMDRPLEEIARIEGIKQGSVRARLSRAKQKLRVMLEPYVKGGL
ncbi:MAG: sigma-70 family RNA polymerase sigma factor, partial [Pirellulales bacterium]|nr:sigma-70 family RNA polymerase sigma factor [Pirellulales bacterium]